MPRVDRDLTDELLAFFVAEAAALDEHRWLDWLDLLDDDFVYVVPVVRAREDLHLSPYSDEMFIAHESKSFLSMRFDRVKSDFAWAERPAAFGRHFVSNLRVHDVDASGRCSVSTNVMLTRSRAPEPMTVSSAERRDVLVRRDGRWLLVRREVRLDVEVPTDGQVSVIY